MHIYILYAICILVLCMVPGTWPVWGMHVNIAISNHVNDVIAASRCLRGKRWWTQKTCDAECLLYNSNYSSTACSIIDRYNIHCAKSTWSSNFHSMHVRCALELVGATGFDDSTIASLSSDVSNFSLEITKKNHPYQQAKDQVDHQRQYLQRRRSQAESNSKGCPRIERWVSCSHRIHSSGGKEGAIWKLGAA